MHLGIIKNASFLLLPNPTYSRQISMMRLWCMQTSCHQELREGPCTTYIHVCIDVFQYVFVHCASHTTFFQTNTIFFRHFANIVSLLTPLQICKGARNPRVLHDAGAVSGASYARGLRHEKGRRTEFCSMPLPVHNHMIDAFIPCNHMGVDLPLCICVGSKATRLLFKRLSVKAAGGDADSRCICLVGFCVWPCFGEFDALHA